MDPNPNPAATLYAATVAVAAQSAIGSVPVASDEIMTITGTLGGVVPESPSELTNAPIVNVTQSAAPIGASVNAPDLIKLALLIIIGAWIGSALLSGRNNG